MLPVCVLGDLVHVGRAAGKLDPVLCGHVRRAGPGDHGVADVGGRTRSVHGDPVLLVRLDGVPAGIDMADLADDIAAGLDAQTSTDGTAPGCEPS
jgi:hypothetical protein